MPNCWHIYKHRFVHWLYFVTNSLKSGWSVKEQLIITCQNILIWEWNSTKFDLNLNSTACKIVPLRPNPSINIIGSGFDWKGLKTWFGFQWKNNRSKQLRFLILILLTWCLTQFSLLALRVKVQGRKGQLKRGQSNCFLIKSISCIKWSIFFHRYHSSGLEDITIFFLDLFPYSDEHICKGDF